MLHSQGGRSIVSGTGLKPDYFFTFKESNIIIGYYKKGER